MKFALMIPTPEVTEQGVYVRVPIGTYAETVNQAAELGFDGIELMLAQPENLAPLEQVLQAQSMEVAGFNSGRLRFDLGLTMLDDTEQVETVFSAVIQAAGNFGTHVSIGMFRGSPAQSQGWGTLVQRFLGYARLAEECGVELLLEPVNSGELPFISTTEEGIAFVQEVNHPHVKLMLDTFHMLREGEDMVASVEAAMPYLRHIHFLDDKRNPPAPDDPDIDVAALFKTLQRHDYRYFLSMPLIKNEPVEATGQRLSRLQTLL